MYYKNKLTYNLQYFTFYKQLIDFHRNTSSPMISRPTKLPAVIVLKFKNRKLEL